MNPNTTTEADKDAELRRVIGVLRALMNAFDNASFVLGSNLSYISQPVEMLARSTRQVTSKAATDVQELLQEIDKSPIYKDLVKRTRKMRRENDEEEQ